MSPVFVDTNILIYAHAAADPVKQRAASEKLALLWSQPGAGVISGQVVKEFFSALTRKLGFSPAKAAQIVEPYLLWRIAPETSESLRLALELAAKRKLAIWDAGIIAAAAGSRVDTLWTEDLNPGEIVAGVRVVNPLN